MNPSQSVQETSLETDTGLLPWVVAEIITEEAWAFANPPEDSVVMLSNRARHMYAVNEVFAEKLRSKHGQEVLYAFMRHWLAGHMIAAGTPRNDIPGEWANGHPIPMKRSGKWRDAR